MKPAARKSTTAFREGPRLRTRGLFFGTDTATAQSIYLAPKWLATGLHLIGPTGSGKSRLLLWLFELLCFADRPLVLIDPKGSLYRMARDWALANGFGKRLVLFDLSGDVLPGYNPLRENGLRIDLQSQWIREGVKNAWGASTFDAAPLLARLLFLCLYVARAMGLSLMDALDVLRPAPELRHAALARITDPFVHGALQAFDHLPDRMKAEQASSTISRLEMFVCDATVRAVMCSKQSLDLEAVLTERKILLVNFAKYQPLLPDTLKLLGRMFFNDLLAHVYKGHGEGRFDEHRPCFVICDEVQNFATRQLCDSLDEGRGIGFHTCIAHQHIAQLADEDASGYLLHSVMNDARTKVVFGDLAFEDLELLAKNTMIDRYDPWRRKDEIRAPVFAPVETTRVTRSRSRSRSRTRGCSYPYTETEGTTEAESHGESSGSSVNFQTHRGTSAGRSRSHTVADGKARTVMNGIADTDMDGESHMSGSGQTSGVMDAHGIGASGAEASGVSMAWDPYNPGAMLPNAMTTSHNAMAGTSVNDVHADSAGASFFEGQGYSHAHGTTISHGEADTTSHVDAQASGESEAEMHSQGFGLSRSHGTSESHTIGRSQAVSRGVTPSESEQQGVSESETIAPFHAYHEREIVSSRTYLSPEEQQLLHIQQLKALPKAHFLLKVPGHAAVFCRAPWVEEPHITKKALAQGLARIHSLPYYTRLEVLDTEGRSTDMPQRRALAQPAPQEDDEMNCWSTEKPAY